METSVENLKNNHFQGLEIEWTYSITGGGSVSINIESFAQLRSYGLQWGINNPTYFLVGVYEGCKFYSSSTNGTRRLSLIDESSHQRTSMDELIAPLKNKIELEIAELTGIATTTPDTPGRIGRKLSDDCAKEIDDCASSGEVAAATFALAFGLCSANTAVTFLRINQDSLMKTWVSLALHGLVIIFASAGIGHFTTQCGSSILEEIEDAFDDPPAGWTASFEYKYGVTFICAISAGVVSAVLLVLAAIFRYRPKVTTMPKDGAGETPIVPP